MDWRKAPKDPDGVTGLSQPKVLRDVVLVALPIILLGAIGNIIGLSTLAGGATVNLGYVLAIVIGALILRRQGSSWRMLGLATPASWAKTVLAGIGAAIGAVAVFVLAQAIFVAVVTALGLELPGIDQSRFNPLEGNLPLLILMLALAWTTIAFGEELFYRAFLISRMVDHAGMSNKLAITISAGIFACAHFAEGPMGIFSNGAFALLFGWIYLKSKRNLWITIVGHGLINTLRFMLLYAGAT
jgi:membrane protease YdiL (CAAX protease family)